MDKDKLLKSLGKRVKELRIKADLTQTELAYKIDKDQPSIGRLERGRVNPSYLYLIEICKGLDVSIEELFDF